MSEINGCSGAALSEQLDMYRLLDTQNRVREGKVSALNDVAWRAQYNYLADSYNRLLTDANRILQLNEEAMAAQSGTIADLRAVIDGLTAENAQLRDRLQTVQSDLDMLRELDKERDPNYYRDRYF